MTDKVTCVVCKGSGVQTCKPKTLTPEGWKEEPEIKIDCIWCHGTGEQTWEEMMEVVTYRASWCKCENRDPIFVERHGTIDTVCGNCDGLIMVG